MPICLGVNAPGPLAHDPANELRVAPNGSADWLQGISQSFRQTVGRCWVAANLHVVLGGPALAAGYRRSGRAMPFCAVGSRGQAVAAFAGGDI